MKVSANIGFDSLSDIKEEAGKLEALGYDTVGTAELSHDPFLQAVLASEGTERAEIMTSIAVAFARSPMTVANMAHDLNSLSGGRFVLGLGSQIEAHITKRFSMPWSHPAARMKEFLQAIRAIWDCWYDGKPLEFRGEFYNHTLMTHYFTPTDTEHGRPKIMLAAVGPIMTQTAAEVADGLLCHGFTTERYVREVTLPNVEAALAKAGRKRKDFEIAYSMMTIAGNTEEALAERRKAVCTTISFYGSTPAYKGIFELHGWHDLQPELNRLSKQGRWDDMAKIIPDEVVDAFAITGTPREVVGEMKKRLAGTIDRTSISFPELDREEMAELISELKSA